MVKLRIAEREADLKDRLENLPRETIKATIGSVLPHFLNNKVASTSWQVMRGVTGFIFRKKDSGKTLFSSAKKWGFFTVAKTLVGLWKK
jgi:hypothetical protein